MLSREWKSAASWKLARRKSMTRVTGDHSKTERSKLKVTRPLNTVTKKSVISSEQESLRTSYMDRVWWPSSLTCVETSKVKVKTPCRHSDASAHNLAKKNRTSTKIGRKYVCARVTLHTSSKVKGHHVVTKNQPSMFLEWQDLQTSNLVMVGARWPALTRAMTSKLKALCGSSSHHLQWAWHIVAAALKAAQLVSVCNVMVWYGMVW